MTKAGQVAKMASSKWTKHVLLSHTSSLSHWKTVGLTSGQQQALPVYCTHTFRAVRMCFGVKTDSSLETRHTHWGLRCQMHNCMQMN